ncbi:helix-turn-helix domain-containing protein [Pontibacter pamirensis]|uniref:helix-turn-helix domain-containing protein n=1 Tax=Pontibacter pamirensis TaxID=2562824 RepID=UPI00138A3F04|nr:helix-turn-helix transcriptional regulator [Pontibacter pamirensis]
MSGAYSSPDHTQTPINERIKLIIEEYKHTPSSFARSIGSSRQTVTNIIEGRNKPSYDFLLSILVAEPDVSSDWLMKGEGHMLKSRAQSETHSINFDKEFEEINLKWKNLLKEAYTSTNEKEFHELILEYMSLVQEETLSLLKAIKYFPIHLSSLAYHAEYMNNIITRRVRAMEDEKENNEKKKDIK